MAAGTVPRFAWLVVIGAGVNDVIRVDIGAGWVNATVAAGEYFYLQDGTAADFCKAIDAALDALGAVFTVALQLDGRLQIIRTGGNFSIDWPNSTVPSLLLGFQGGIDSSAGGVLTSEHQVRRLWNPETLFYLDTETVPQHRTHLDATSSGRTVGCSWGSGRYLRAVAVDNLPARKIWVAYESLRHEAFERFHDGVSDGTRFYFTPNRLVPAVNGCWVIADPTWMTGWPAEHIPQCNRVWRVPVPMRQYVP